MASIVLEASLLSSVVLATPPEKSEGAAAVSVVSAPSSPSEERSALERYEAMRAANKERGPYDPGKALDDLRDCKLAMDLFLSSNMIESEVLLREGDPKMERLYITTGYALIEAVKALMSFEDKVSRLERSAPLLVGRAFAYNTFKLYRT
jgi:hypothetical protein